MNLIFILLFLIFSLVPILEILVLIKIGQAWGIWKTLLLLIAITVVGIVLVRLQGLILLQKIQNNLHRGILPSSEMLDGFLIFCAGALLLMPGFLTDILGLILLFPMTRWLLKRFLRWKMQSMVSKGEVITINRVSRFRNIDQIL